MASNVPYGRRLFLYSWLSTGDSGFGGWRPFAYSDANPGNADALWGIANLSSSSHRKSARRRVYRHARLTSALVARQADDSCTTGVRCNGFHYHHHTFLGGCNGSPYRKSFRSSSLHGQSIAITLVLVSLLGAVFLKGFTEAIGIAVVLTTVYLFLNAIVLAVGAYQVATHAHTLVEWKSALIVSHGSPLAMIGISLLLFPKLALGLSGFETGVAVMPLVKGSPKDTKEKPAGRIRYTHRLLVCAALIMSVFLIASSLVTTLLISPTDFRSASETLPAGPANGRALAYLAHRYLGDGFGTLYDLSTILILWFAGASAMAGLLNIVPRYLPRYGMAPEWAGASRPLVIIYCAIAFAVTIIFRADVDAQGGAYATGVSY